MSGEGEGYLCVEVHGSRHIGHCCWMLGVQFAHTQTWPQGRSTWLACHGGV